MNFGELVDIRRTPDGAPAPSRDARGRDLESILNVLRKINTSLVLSDVLELVIDEAIRITKAERGFLMLARAGRQLEFAVGRDAAGRSIIADAFQVSSSVLEDVFTTGESLCIEHALTDERFERRQSILHLELQTILCTPLKTQDETIGVIYVDSKYIQSVDQEETLSLFEILAGQAAIAIKNARLYEDLRSTYAALAQANDQIVKFERMATKGEIAAEVSHELKNMVSVVLLNLEMMQKRMDTIPPEQLRTTMEKVLQGAKKIQRFSHNLMTQAHASATAVPRNPNVVIEEFLEFVRALPKYKHNRFTVSLADDLPDIPLDAEQIHQVLLNLVSNAIEAKEDACLTLTTRFADGRVFIDVSDDGPGIPDEVRDRLFLQKITTKPNGHGYGLRICRQIVEHHGGTMGFVSGPHQGTTFTIAFPAAPQEGC